ncbi:hypothetical protein WA026_019810 [Henosepilachna vigintioctopunctata]|uniref:RNase H type-1 domain-containing protein n=1 Tax=Henosepilachna vigintioctopunctata TaxID=420089 RepID=A0AAW1VGY6_9CUCU
MLPDKPNNITRKYNIQKVIKNKTNLDHSAEFMELKSKYHEYTTLYTDASDPQNGGNMGLGIYCPDRNIKLSGSLSGNFSICTSEVAAIMIAVNVIEEENIKISIIFTDSQSAFERISNWKISVNNDEITMLTRDRINEIKNLRWEITFIWIHSQTNIPGTQHNLIQFLSVTITKSCPPLRKKYGNTGKIVGRI